MYGFFNGFFLEGEGGNVWGSGRMKEEERCV